MTSFLYRSVLLGFSGIYLRPSPHAAEIAGAAACPQRPAA
jgi:hypothetical protein